MNIPVIIMLAAIAVLIITSVVLLVRKILDNAHDNKVMATYQKEMNKKRIEKLRAEEKKKTYYTTYNELEPEERKKQINNKEIADCAKWRFNRNRKRNRPINYK